MTKKLKNSLDNQKENFLTADLGCAAALISVGFELISLDRQNSRRVIFVFKKKVGADEVVSNYFLNRLKVDARNFFDTIKMLKNLIYNN